MEITFNPAEARSLVPIIGAVITLIAVLGTWVVSWRQLKMAREQLEASQKIAGEQLETSQKIAEQQIHASTVAAVRMEQLASLRSALVDVMAAGAKKCQALY